jgi:hypothetical protein
MGSNVRMGSIPILGTQINMMEKIYIAIIMLLILAVILQILGVMYDDKP